MKKSSVLIAIIIISMFNSCGSGGSSSSNKELNNVKFSPYNDSNLEPLYKEQWYINKNVDFYNNNAINSAAHIQGKVSLEKYSGKNIKIAVIDDSLDVFHEDLKGSILATYDLISKTSDVSSYDNKYHGTSVTGIIASKINGKGIRGIAHNAQIIFLKLKKNMSDSETIELFNKAQSLGADIINCSWGTGNVSLAVKAKIIDLSNNGRNGKGIPIVFASGNHNVDILYDESSIKEVISVGATNKDNLRANYSNYGDNLDIVAPGGNVLGITTLDPMGLKGRSLKLENYNTYNDTKNFIGTSASAPIVSSMIALMLEKSPSLTRVEIENILKNTAEKLGYYSYTSGHNKYYGYGKVNLDRAINAIH